MPSSELSLYSELTSSLLESEIDDIFNNKSIHALAILIINHTHAIFVHNLVILIHTLMLLFRLLSDEMSEYSSVFMLLYLSNVSNDSLYSSLKS